jgi:alpha-mannosidase
VSFGYGDGGGGPTREMLEFSTRMEKGIPGCPTVKKGKIIDFFRNLDENMSKAKHVPKWVGELYLEFHRGTYTSVARNKRGNRKNEHLYMDNEFLYSLYKMADKKAEYPVADIKAGWKTLLLNHFHDILPGSSIFEVYEDSKADYERIFNKGNELKDKALSGIAGNIGLASDSVVVFNSLGFTRGDIAEFELPEKFRDGFEIIDENGESLAYQFAFNKPNTVVFFAPDIPAKGYKSFALKQAKAEAREGFVYADKTFMSNRYFDVMLDANGNISSIFDKSAKREVLQTGKVANQLIAFEDKPLGYDAWDINVFYQDKAWEINDIRSMEVVESGPVRACIRIVRGFSDSTITNDLYIYNDIPRMDFKTVVDWKEMETMLKVAFPVEIHSDKATYEIQYGNLERNTHWNTSWDYSKFEVCAHKWADLSESGYGVSLLNDCKYGHDIKDSVMRLTLLKSAVFPNPQADKEVHEFTYSIYPHEGDWRDADTVSQAYGLNYPLYAVAEEKHSGAMPETMSLISVDKNNCVIEVVKKAEDSNDLIVRMYECHNRRGKVAVRFAQPLTKVYECDMLENNLNEVDVTDTGFEFELNPYEIKTFKLTVK